MRFSCVSLFFFFNDTATTEIYTLSLHDALPIWLYLREESRQTREVALSNARVEKEIEKRGGTVITFLDFFFDRLEEHTSELQSPCNLVCRLLLEKKKIKHTTV